ncbi:hypothetical protein [Rossellomorea marisflavi]|uniref:hypothetical protein n=1 Tax=Rossellomorea marisflavi TaxID=189381 RepID=UPI0009A57A4C|nr:hypothetical protein [Rossellomorea marisflavi]
MEKRLDFLEALRGYAIIGVVFTHVSAKIEGLSVWLNNFGVQGAKGVQLFFWSVHLRYFIHYSTGLKKILW